MPAGWRLTPSWCRRPPPRRWRRGCLTAAHGSTPSPAITDATAGPGHPAAAESSIARPPSAGRRGESFRLHVPSSISQRSRLVDTRLSSAVHARHSALSRLGGAPAHADLRAGRAGDVLARFRADSICVPRPAHRRPAFLSNGALWEHGMPDLRGVAVAWSGELDGEARITARLLYEGAVGPCSRSASPRQRRTCSPISLMGRRRTSLSSRALTFTCGRTRKLGGIISCSSRGFWRLTMRLPAF